MPNPEASRDCMSKAVRCLKAEHPEMEKDQIVAIALKKCGLAKADFDEKKVDWCPFTVYNEVISDFFIPSDIQGVLNFRDGLVQSLADFQDIPTSIRIAMAVDDNLPKLRESNPDLSEAELLMMAYEIARRYDDETADFIRDDISGLGARFNELKANFETRNLNPTQSGTKPLRPHFPKREPGSSREFFRIRAPLSQSATAGKTSSSNIAEIGYDNGRAQVLFNNGYAYEYDVSPQEYEAFAASASKGEHLWNFFRGKSPGRVIDNPNKMTPGGVGGSIVPYMKTTGNRISTQSMEQNIREVYKKLKSGGASISRVGVGRATIQRRLTEIFDKPTPKTKAKPSAPQKKAAPSTPAAVLKAAQKSVEKGVKKITKAKQAEIKKEERAAEKAKIQKAAEKEKAAEKQVKKAIKTAEKIAKKVISAKKEEKQERKAEKKDEGALERAEEKRKEEIALAQARIKTLQKQLKQALELGFDEVIINAIRQQIKVLQKAIQSDFIKYPGGVYIAVRPTPETAAIIQDYQEAFLSDFKFNEDLHSTLIYSKKPHEGDIPVSEDTFPAQFKQFNIFGEENDVLVIELESKALKDRNKLLTGLYGFVSDYDEYKPHLTLVYGIPKDFNVSELPPLIGELEFTDEYVEPLDEDYVKKAKSDFDVLELKVVNDFAQVVSDSKYFKGPITRAGPFQYPDGIKYKNFDNQKEAFSKITHLPAFDSHNENRIVGFAYNFKPNEDTQEIEAEGYTFEDIEETSDIPAAENRAVSIRYTDSGKGNKQHIEDLIHLAISLNNTEQDRCSSAGGSACYVSFNEPAEIPALTSDFGEMPMPDPDKKEKHDKVENGDEVKDDEEEDKKKKTPQRDKTPESDHSEAPNTAEDFDGDYVKIKKEELVALKQTVSDMNQYVEGLKQAEAKKRAAAAEEIRARLLDDPRVSEDFIKTASIEQLEVIDKTLKPIEPENPVVQKDFMDSFDFAQAKDSVQARLNEKFGIPKNKQVKWS